MRDFLIAEPPVEGEPDNDEDALREYLESVRKTRKMLEDLRATDRLSLEYSGNPIFNSGAGNFEHEARVYFSKGGKRVPSKYLLVTANLRNIEYMIMDINRGVIQLNTTSAFGSGAITWAQNTLANSTAQPNIMVLTEPIEFVSFRYPDNSGPSGVITVGGPLNLTATQIAAYVGCVALWAWG